MTNEKTKLWQNINQFNWTLQLYTQCSQCTQLIWDFLFVHTTTDGSQAFPLFQRSRTAYTHTHSLCVLRINRQIQSKRSTFFFFFVVVSISSCSPSQLNIIWRKSQAKTREMVRNAIGYAREMWRNWKCEMMKQQIFALVSLGCSIVIVIKLIHTRAFIRQCTLWLQWKIVNPNGFRSRLVPIRKCSSNRRRQSKRHQPHQLQRNRIVAMEENSQ